MANHHDLIERAIGYACGLQDGMNNTFQSVCCWEYNAEHERWDTECDQVIALHGGESPFEYGFIYCPYCGSVIIPAPPGEDE